MKQQSQSDNPAPDSGETKRVYIDQPLAITNLKKIIHRQLKLNYEPHQKLVVICIGTDRSTGDALGPLVGTKLKKFKLPAISLLGTLSNPIHATNLEEKLTALQSRYSDPFIIAIDAGLGSKDSVGAIEVQAAPLEPGSGIDKELPKVGELSITGLVNIGGHMEYLVLQSTRLHTVLKMARKIAYSLAHGLKTIH